MSPFHLSFRSVLKSHRVSDHHHHHPSRRAFVDTTINWVRDRGLDHVVQREKNLRPIINIKNLIKSEPSRSLPITILTQSRESLMIPTRPIEFVRQYPSIFEEFLPGGIAVQPHVRLTPQVLDIDAKEHFMYQTDSYKHQVADRLFRLLMLVRSNKLPLNVIELFNWDLGLPPDYERSIVPEYPDYFKIVVGKSGSPELEMVCWSNELATSVMERRTAKGGFVKGMPIAFPMHFSRGFEMDKKLNKWIDEWQKLPYVSPYENAAHLSSQSDESDKWAVAVLHELLHILVPKKTDRENIFILGEYLGIRSRFKRALLHHPGILYVSSKLRTYTVVLREGYKRGAIIENHPLMDIRSQYIHLMNAMREDGKTISAKEKKKKKGVEDSKGEDVKEEDEESEEGLEGELSDSSEAEVDHDDVDSDNDEEDEEDEDERMTSIHKNDAVTRGRGARKSNFDVMTPSRNAERGRSGGRRAWKSEFDVKAPSRNAERGRSDGRRAWKSEFDVKAPSTNAERGRLGGKYPGKRGNEVSLETSGRTQADARHNVRSNSRERSNRSRSRGRSFADKKTYV